MADITYFVISSDDCKYEGMTKEQIVAAIAEATGNAPTSIDDAFISKIKEINASGTVQIWNGTEAQFNALSPAPAVNKSAIRVGTNGILYICTDDTTLESVAAHASTHATDGSDPITPESIGASAADHTHTPSDIGAQGRFLCGRNQTIATSAWASDTTYADYPYRASVALPTITALSFVEIVFSPADATSGNFAPVCDTYNGGVYIYAKAVPDAAITIPTIIIWR